MRNGRKYGLSNRHGIASSEIEFYSAKTIFTHGKGTRGRSGPSLIFKKYIITRLNFKPCF